MRNKEGEPVHIPIEDSLDLHTFHPREAVSVLQAYLEACQQKKIYRVRIIHGKGTGLLRKKVHAFLQSSPLVKSFSLASSQAGSWGATIVFIKEG
ncbi:MAG: Smr/MutS family protein [bacterium]